MNGEPGDVGVENNIDSGALLPTDGANHQGRNCTADQTDMWVLEIESL